MLAPWKESYDKTRQCIKKERHHFADKGPSSQSFGFSSSHVCMWELDHKESWEPKELMLLNCGVGEDSRVPWTAKRSNQSILKENSPEHSLEGQMLKLKLQYFGHLMGRADSLGKTGCWEILRAGEKGSYWWWDGWMASSTQCSWVWADSQT